MVLDNTVILAILAVIAGGGVAGYILKGVVNALKKWLKIEGGWKAVVLAIFTSVVATAFVLVTTGTFALLPFVGYSLMIFMISSGWYHMKDDKPI